MIEFKEAKGLKDYDSVTLAEMLRDRFTRTYPIAEVNRLTGAIQVASYLHRHDVRRGNRGKMPNPPYIEHPLRVAFRLMRDFDVESVDTILAAVLHDTVEDHPHEFSEFVGVQEAEREYVARYNALQYISETFGFGVASIVEKVSNPLIVQNLDKAIKVKVYHDHVKTTIASSEKARILKFSDFVDNAGSLHHHYEYNDPKAKYFIERYAPLIPLYRDAFKLPADTYLPDKALRRLADVEEQFDKFRVGLDIPLPVA